MYYKSFFILLAIFQVEIEANSLSSSANFDEKCDFGERCVPYYQCNEFGGVGIFSIGESSSPSPCPSMRKCCEHENIDESVPEVEMPDSCGYRNADGIGYYTLGKQNESQYGEFPWTIAVLNKVSYGNKVMAIFSSGASLIHPQIVLTAAHKLNDSTPDELIVRGGEWNTLSTDEMFMHQERDVKDIVKHPNFKRDNLHNDIALLFLVKKFKLAPHINTICMPKPSYNHDGQNCFAAGWGKYKFGIEGQYQNYLKKVELPVLSHEKCEKKMKTTLLGEDFILHPKFMCAGGQKNVDVCTGDGGGALMCQIPGKPGYYYQAGIVAWGLGCHRKNLPGVYIDVQKYLPWIQEQVAEKNFYL